MKKLLITLCLLPSLLLAQSNLDNKIRAKDLNHRGLSDYRYKAADSIAVNVTLPAATTTATSALTMATANATGIASITPTVTRLTLPRSVNLFNYADPLSAGGKQISSDGASMFTAGNLYVSGFVPVKPVTPYAITGKNRIIFLRDDKTLISIIDGIRSTNGFTTPAGTAYLRFSIDIAANPLATYMLVEGTSLPSGYVPYTNAKLTVVSDRQLFNINDPGNLYGQFLSSTGTLGALTGWNVTHFIPTTPGQVLYESIKHNAAFYDANKTLITPSPDATIYSSARANQALTTPAGAAYVRFRVDVASWEKFMVSATSYPVPWEPYVTPVDVPVTATPKVVKLIIGSGQSNGQGAVDWSQNHRTPMPWGTYPPGYSGALDGASQISSATAVGNNRTFSTSGPSLVPLTGIGYNMSTEGYVRGFMDHIATKYPGEDMVFFSHALGGKTIEYLDKPTPSEITSGTATGGLAIPNTSGEYLMNAAGKPITQITEYDITQFASPYYQGMWLIAKSTQLAKAEGKTAEVAAVLWLQGEANADAGTLNYSALLQAHYDEYNRDVQLITGQTKKINWFFEETNYSNQSEISGQAGYDNWVANNYSAAFAPGGASSSYTLEANRTNNHYIINAQQQAAARDGVKSLPARNMFLWGPRYHLTSRVHMDTYIARRHGEQAAKLYARQVLEAQTPAAPFLPTSWWIEGASVYVRFQVPKPPLQLVSPPNSVTVTGKGRGFSHSAGAIQPGNVSVIGEDVIKITPDVAPAAGQTISYVVNVRSGDLTDSDTQPGLFTDRAGSAYTLTNYALPFSLTLSSPVANDFTDANKTAVEVTLPAAIATVAISSTLAATQSNLFNGKVSIDKYINTTTFLEGNFGNYYLSDYQNVAGWTKLKVTGLPSYSANKAIIFYDAGKTQLRDGSNNPIGYKITSPSLEFTLPTGTVYVKFTVKESADATVTLNGVSLIPTAPTTPVITRLGGLALKDEEFGSPVITTVAGDNLFKVSTVRSGWFINTSTYTIGTISNYYLSDYIPVTPGMIIQVKGLQSYSANKAIVYLDASKASLKDVSNNNLGEQVRSSQQIFVCPANCYFIAVTIKEASDASTDFSAVEVTPYTKTVSGLQLPNGSYLPFASSSTSTKKSVTIIKPKRVYTVANDLLTGTYASPNRSYSNALYVDHLVNYTTVYKARFLETNSDKYPLFSPVAYDNSTYNNGVTSFSSTVAITLTGDVVDQAVSFTQVSTKASAGASNQVRYLQIGDSNTAGTGAEQIGASATGPTRLFEYLGSFFAMDKLDAGSPSGSHNFLSLGTVSPRSFTVSYGGSNVALKAYCEGRGSWAATDYALYPDKWTTSYGQGLWDLLGLGSGTGSDWTGSAAQLSSMFTTAAGVNAPKNTAAFLSFMQARYSGITDYSSAVTYLNNLLANPTNPFFNNSKTGGYKFDFALYLSRYKTLADDGVTRLTVGSTAGTKVSSNTAYDVCTPTHVYIQLGTNDRQGSWYLSAMQAMITSIKAVSSGIHVGVACGDGTGTYFPDLYPETEPVVTLNSYTHGLAYYCNDQLSTLDSDASKTFHIPTYFVQPTALSIPYRNVPLAESLGSSSSKNLFTVRMVSFPESHYNTSAHASGGYQVYSWLKYTQTLP